MFALRAVLIATASVALFFLFFWLLNALIGPQWGAGIAATLMYLVLPAVGLRLWRTHEATSGGSLEEARLAGEVLSAEFEVSEALEVEESEDEGFHFFLAISEDRTLFLSGQYLYEPKESGAFPSTRIRLHWHKTLDFTYLVECLGVPLREVQKLPPFSLEQFEREAVPQDRQVFDAPLQVAVAR